MDDLVHRLLNSALDNGYNDVLYEDARETTYDLIEQTSLGEHEDIPWTQEDLARVSRSIQRWLETW